MYLFAFDTRVTPPSLSSVRALTAGETSAFRDAVSRLVEFEAAGDLLPLVEANERAAASVVAGVQGAPRTRLEDPGTRAAFTLEVNRALFNYLASVRLYLDHTGARLTRRYGDDGAPTRAFKAATAHAFDSTPAYRVLYKLRNYVQHVGMPVRGLAFSASADGGPGGPGTGAVTHTVAVGCDRQALLDSYDAWGKARADLEAMPATIDIPPLLAAGSAALRTVEARVLAAEVSPLRELAAGLVALLAEVGPGVRGAVADLRVDGPATEITTLRPPLGVLTLLGVPTDAVAML